MILLKVVEINTFIHLKVYGVYGVNFINVQNNEEVILTVTVFIGYMKLKSHLYGINEKKSKLRGKLD